jgi:DNA processing protein
MEEILHSGAVLSEYPPGTEARPHHFPRRNRILAALAHRLVVVEAAERSGALITARDALELGREVWAVPGSIFSPGSPGTHALIRDGAVPVVSVGEWAEALREDRPEGMAPVAPSGEGRAGQLPLGLGGEGLSARLLEELGDAPRSVETLLARVGAEPSLVLAALARLELGGWVERAGPDRYRKRAA